MVLSIEKKRHQLNQRAHSKIRLRERFGIVINRIAYKEIVSRIKKPYCGRPCRVAWHIAVSWKTKKRSLWVVSYQGQVLPVIYDKATESVVTIFPRVVLDYIDQNILEMAKGVLNEQ